MSKMDDKYVDMEKENQKQEDSVSSLSKSVELEERGLAVNVPGCKHWSMVRGEKPRRKLVFNSRQIKGFETWVQGLFLDSSHGLHGSSIPKHLVSVDEKYLRLCLEAIHLSALESTSCRVSVNANPISTQYVPGSYGSSDVLRSSLDVDNFVIGYPIASLVGDECVTGSITESNSMLNILKSPLFQSLGPLSKEAKFRSSMLDDKSFNRSELTRSGGLSSSPSQKLESVNFGMTYDGYKTDALQRSPVSIASAHSVFTDQSCQSSSMSNFQGMLQCTWKGGLPHFEFSVDDHKETYVANAFKIELPNDDRSVDYVYSFHSKFSVPYDEFHGEPDSVGKMRVSTSLSLCPNNSKVTETEFVLYGVNEGQGGDFQLNSRIGKRRRKLSKVMEVLRPSQTVKRRSPTLFGGTSAIFEERLKNIEEESGVTRSGFLPELELAAIVVKDHTQESDHQEEIGGWGLNFLKKAGYSKIPSQNCKDCTTGMSIILPAGFHGTPATGNGGPTSILGRWKSGGHCDCGGWDTGCPLRILKSIPRIEPHSKHSQKDYCKSFDIFPEGSEQGIPVMKVTNVHEGLYYITFRSSLPVLQCFSIAVAMVHSQSPQLCPKHVQM